MGEIQGVLLLVGLLALRFVVPLAITIGLGYLLVRLDERWRAEAAAASDAAGDLARDDRPVQPRPTPALSFPAVANAPCWVLRACEPARQAACPATQRPEQPCWLTRMQIEGRLPASCQGCPLFTQAVGRD